MSEIHSKISLDRFSPLLLSTDKNHLIANDFYFYPLATLGFNYTRNYMHHCYFERAAGLNREKLGAHKAEDDFKPHGFEEKIRFFRFF